VTALAAVVAVAAVDAVRGREADDPPAPATIELANRNAIAGQLAALGARGELVLYGDDCSVQLLALPSLERTQGLSDCGPRGSLSPDGIRVARCLGERTELFDRATGVRTLPGCTPAWQPDGTLTVAHERAVVRFRRCPGAKACPVTLIPSSELERAARRHPTVPNVPVRLRVLIDGIAWLSQTRAAVQLSIRMGGRLAGIGALSAIAFFENGRLTETQPYFRVTGGRIAASSRGTYATQTPDVILRRDGTQVNLPAHLRVASAFAWSADERLLALATRFAVVVVDVTSLERYDATGAGLRSVTLPLSVTELAWR
jgi:hypothetical protein